MNMKAKTYTCKEDALKDFDEESGEPVINEAQKAHDEAKGDCTKCSIQNECTKGYADASKRTEEALRTITEFIQKELEKDPSEVKMMVIDGLVNWLVRSFIGFCNGNPIPINILTEGFKKSLAIGILSTLQKKQGDEK